MRGNRFKLLRGKVTRSTTNLVTNRQATGYRQETHMARAREQTDGNPRLFGGKVKVKGQIGWNKVVWKKKSPAAAVHTH